MVGVDSFQPFCSTIVLSTAGFFGFQRRFSRKIRTGKNGNGNSVPESPYAMAVGMECSIHEPGDREKTEKYSGDGGPRKVPLEWFKASPRLGPVGGAEDEGHGAAPGLQ